MMEWRVVFANGGVVRRRVRSSGATNTARGRRQMPDVANLIDFDDACD